MASIRVCSGLLVTLATAIAFGVLPALRIARVAPNRALIQQSRSTTSTRGQGRVRNALAGAQLAFAFTLMIGAGVLLASFYTLLQVDLGFRVDRVLTLDISLPTHYTDQRRIAAHDELARRIGDLPGVTAGGISRLPTTGRAKRSSRGDLSKGSRKI
ncbi:MAG: hypothetical protein WEE89_18135 [Gemmatimonadota bacterium]